MSVVLLSDLCADVRHQAKLSSRMLLNDVVFWRKFPKCAENHLSVSNFSSFVSYLFPLWKSDSATRTHLRHRQKGQRKYGIREQAVQGTNSDRGKGLTKAHANTVRLLDVSLERKNVSCTRVP